MSEPANLSAAIVDVLYAEALDLADETRAAFDFGNRLQLVCENAELARIALSSEALRTTTRMMHALAWLLNHRAYFNGDMSEFQLRRHGRLPPRPAAEKASGEPDDAGLLPPELAELVMRTHRFYARLERLDSAMRERYAMQPPAIQRLRGRLGQAVASL